MSVEAVSPVASHRCVCPNAGDCHFFSRPMYGNFHRVCKGEPGIDPKNREALLTQFYAEREERARARAGKTLEDGTCVHLGPYTGEQRECVPCGGKTREKVYACALHGETTFKDCRRCKDGLKLDEELGGMGPGAHSLDHYALTFAKGGQMALYEADGRARHMPGVFSDETCYFLGGGPSLADVDLAPLVDRFTIAVNSVCEVFPRPSVWIGIDPPDDPPDRFRNVPWADPTVIKLLPRSWAGCDTGGMKAYLRPSTRFFLRNHRWAPWSFLSERTVNWGSDQPFGGARSVMLASLKLAWYLGARRIVLLGADFHMDPSRPYCHSAPKDEHGSATNNDKFGVLERRLRQLRPYLERAGVTVVNATVGSRLEAFDRTTLEEELSRCSS